MVAVRMEGHLPLSGGGGATGMARDSMGLDWSRKW